VSLAAVTGTGATDVAFGIDLVLAVAMVAGTYATAIILKWPLALVWASVGLAALVALAMSRWWLTTKRVKPLDRIPDAG
jgi:Na+-driven multidrug efflux pump